MLYDFFFFLIIFFPKTNESSGNHDDIFGCVDSLIPIDLSFLTKLNFAIVSLATVLVPYVYRRQWHRFRSPWTAPRCHVLVHNFTITSHRSRQRQNSRHNEHTAGFTFFIILSYSDPSPKHIKLFPDCCNFVKPITEIWPTSLRLSVFGFFHNKHFYQFWLGIHNLWAWVCFFRCSV